MRGFQKQPNPELMRERLEKLRRAKQDLRGVGWMMLAGELIQTWLGVFIMGVLAAQQAAPQIAALDVGDVASRAAAALKALGTEWYANAAAILSPVLAVLAAVPAFVFARRRNLSVRAELSLNGLGAGEIGIMYAAMMGFNALGVVGVMGTELLFNTAGYSVYIDIVMKDTPLSFWMTVLYAALLGPLIEEYVYRGVLLDSIRPYGDRFAVVSSAVIFGLAHGNLMQFLPAALIGWFLGYVRVKTGSWGVCVLLHALNNLTSLLLESLLERVTNESLYGAINLAYIAAMVIAFALIWRKLKARCGELAEPAEPVGYGALVSAPALIYLYLVFQMLITNVSKLA